MIEQVQPATLPAHQPEFEAPEAQPQRPLPGEGEAGGNDAAAETVSELIEQAWRAAGHLALRETQLAVVSHEPQLRRAASDLAIALSIVMAFLTAFALANWAAASALSRPLPGWAAALVLATTWIVIGILLLVLVLNRGDRVFDWRHIRRLGTDTEQSIKAREQARDEAEYRMRESLDRLAEGFGEQAGVLVSSALVRTAGDVISASADIIEGIDEITHDIGKAVPGGGVINRAADMALLPGRYLVSVARTSLEGLSDELKPSVQSSSMRARRRKASGLDRRNTA